MELASRELESGILGIDLAGRMDITGTQQIDMKFTALTSTRRAQILVDLSKVTFISSIWNPHARHQCQGTATTGRIDGAVPAHA